MVASAPPVAAAAERRRNRPDLFLIGAIAALSAFGLLMIYSATRFELERSAIPATFSMERQMIFVTVGLLALAGFSFVDYREYRSFVPSIYGGTILLLLLVFLFDPVKGARRWINLGFFNLQPAELAKITVILTTAFVLSSGPPGVVGWGAVLRSGALAALPAGLILVEPDLGTALVIPFIWVVMLFAAGLSWRRLGALAGMGAALVAVVFRAGLLREHQIDRLRVFLDPSVDPQGIGYNLRQSKLAIGSGQILGKGLFQGTQTNLSYVPEQETDFIFTAVGEQLGFVGGLAVILAFLVIVWRLLVIALNSRDRFGALLAVGVAALITFHVFINIGMTMGIAPVTGLPLPFLSQGGSFYIAMAAAAGMANSVWLRRSPVPGETFIV